MQQNDPGQTAQRAAAGPAAASPIPLQAAPLRALRKGDGGSAWRLLNSLQHNTTQSAPQGAARGDKE